MDLCGECLQASERALAEDRYHREAVVDFVTQEPPQDPEAFFTTYVLDNKYAYRWAEGLGLMSQTDRVSYMYKKTKGIFLASIRNGDKVPVALEAAFGTGYRQDHTAQALQSMDLTGG
jgi:hypothetical protein